MRKAEVPMNVPSCLFREDQDNLNKAMELSLQVEANTGHGNLSKNHNAHGGGPIDIMEA